MRSDVAMAGSSPWRSRVVLDRASEVAAGVGTLPYEHAETTWILALNQFFDGRVPEMNDRLRERPELEMKTL